MLTCIEIFNREKRDSEIGGSIYVDPNGFEYQKSSIVKCLECIFFMGQDSCVLKKEEGLSDEKIKNDIFNVYKNNECNYFLIKNYSEGGNEDEETREEIENIAKELNYPKERWERHNISVNMDIKGIGFNIYTNENCTVCKFCQKSYSEIRLCNYHNIKIFTNERVCDFFQSIDGNNKRNEIIYSEMARHRFIPLGIFFVKGKKDQCIVYDKNKNIVIQVDNYLLRIVKYDSSNNQIIFEYIHKKMIFNIDTKLILEENDETEDKEELSYWSNVSDEELFEEVDRIYNNAKKYDLYEVANHRDGCEYCKFVVRNSNSATNLQCINKNIFVPANLQCIKFKR